MWMPLMRAIQCAPPSVDLVMPPESRTQWFTSRHIRSCAAYKVFGWRGSMARSTTRLATADEKCREDHVLPPSEERWTLWSGSSHVSAVTRFGALRSTMICLSGPREEKGKSSQLLPPLVDLPIPFTENASA